MKMHGQNQKKNTVFGLRVIWYLTKKLYINYQLDALIIIYS